MNNEQQTPHHSKPQVGVAVFIVRDGKFVIGKRLGAHGRDTWALPGGKLEFGESPEETAVREAFEETGVWIANPQLAAVTNDIFESEGKHFVTLWMVSLLDKNEPYEKEKDKFIELDWCDFSSLPAPLFLPWKNLLASPYLSVVKDFLSSTSKQR